ncbi:phosphatase PAP2 family protein [Terrabacter sp. 2YAF2]|uniref:phosphatase PAP2 family protein n=1 Tax=Terrabacter sp. 2YAF2 TaxID=3233026 RepID=UPI003F9B125E
MTTRPSTPTVRSPAPTRRSAPEDARRRLTGPLVALLLAAGLVVVTASVVQGGPSARLDDLVYALTPGRDNGPAVPDLLALGIVHLATPALGVAALIAVATVLSGRVGGRGPLVVAGPALAVLTVTVLLGKAVIPRGAPGYGQQVLSDGGSYPSGHTATALICAGVLAEIVSRLHPARRARAWLAAGAWTLLVAAALLWEHFHWLSDVVGSMFLGSLVLWLLLRWPLQLGERVAPRRRHGDGSSAR